MLRLRQKICGDEFGAPGFIANNHNLSRSGDRIDTGYSKHQLLRRGDVSISWSGDLVDARHCLGAERQCRDRLRTANRVNLSNTKFDERRGHGWIVRQRSRRRGDNNPLDTRDLRRYSIHYYRRWISRSASRHVQTNSLEWCYSLAQLDAGRWRDGPRLFELALVKRPYVCDRLAQGYEHALVNTLSQPAQLFFTNSKLFELNTVELCGIIDQRLIAASPNILDDRRHELHQLSVEYDRSRLQPLHQLLNVANPANHVKTDSNSSTNRPTSSDFN